MKGMIDMATKLRTTKFFFLVFFEYFFRFFLFFDPRVHTPTIMCVCVAARAFFLQ